MWTDLCRASQTYLDWKPGSKSNYFHSRRNNLRHLEGKKPPATKYKIPDRVSLVKIELDHDPERSWLKLEVKRLLSVMCCCEIFRNCMEVVWMTWLYPPSFQQHLSHLPVEFQEPLERREAKASVRSGWQTTLLLQDLLHCSRIAKSMKGIQGRKCSCIWFTQNIREMNGVGKTVQGEHSASLNWLFLKKNWV